MKVLNTFLGASTFALLVAVGFAAPAPPSEEIPPAPTGECKPTYTKIPYVLDAEDITATCYIGGCTVPKSVNITTRRGEGLAYYKSFTIAQPWLFPNAAAWQVINCTSPDFAGKDESYACANNSIKALYSPGKSPWDPKLKPRLGTVHFPSSYILSSLESLYVTPIRLPKGTKSAIFEITGYKLGGKRVSYTAKLDLTGTKKRFLVSGLRNKGFTEITAFDFWLSAGGKGGYEFALDDLSLEEYRRGPVPASCNEPTTTTPPKAPCTPTPTRTTTFVANADEFRTQASVPTPYKTINWNGYITAVNQSNIQSWVYPPVLVPASGKNVYQGFSPLTFTANTYEQRFGVKSLAIACAFQPYQPDDFSGTNNAPCIVSFVGRRDPYDGSGLPTKVVANFTIPNPGGNVTSQRMTRIDLHDKFQNLYSLNVFTKLGKYQYDTQVFLDDIVFTRWQGAKRCRSPGSSVLTFDDIKVPGTSPIKAPSVYKGFKLPDTWGIVARKNYPVGSPGYISVISPPNALWNGWKEPDVFGSPELDSYVNPGQNFLFDFEEVTITLNVPGYHNTTGINDIRISISVTDACGAGGSSDILSINRQPYFYWRSIGPDGKIQLRFAEPLKAISKMYISASRTSGDFGYVDLFIDNFVYRKYEGPTPGCQQCGHRGGDFCELPRIPR